MQYVQAKGLLLLFIYSKQCVSDGPVLFQLEDFNNYYSLKTLQGREKGRISGMHDGDQIKCSVSVQERVEVQGLVFGEWLVKPVVSSCMSFWPL